jgi:hypothetical protein
MPSSRVATWLALLAGALIGGAAAVVVSSRSRPPPPPPAVTEPAPVSTPSAAPERRAVAEAAPADAAPESAPTGPVTAYAPSLPNRPGALKTASLHCAWGQIEACLQTAAAFRDGRGTDADPGEARLYEHRARELAIELCEEGHAEACYAMAYMYEHGVGVARKPEKVAGLIARVRMLCHINAVPICRRVVQDADGG